jgi:hypothetical protein
MQVKDNWNLDAEYLPGRVVDGLGFQKGNLRSAFSTPAYPFKVADHHITGEYRTCPVFASSASGLLRLLPQCLSIGRVRINPQLPVQSRRYAPDGTALMKKASAVVERRPRFS